MAISDAISQTAVASVLGYALDYKDFSKVAPNLPQRIMIFSPIEESKQAGFTDYNIRHTETSVQDVIDKFGICPAYYAMRILKPIQGGGIGSIPIDIFPILETTGVKATGDLSITGVATKTVNHTVKINGRKFIDGRSATYTVEKDDTNELIKAKIITAINNLIGAAVVASDGGVGVVTNVSKWQTVTANEITIDIDVGNDSAGITYVLPTMASGAGSFDISTALANIGEVWNTIAINCFDETLFDVFESFNGAPAETGGTGRWNAQVVKPFISVLGTNESDKATLLALSSGRKDDLTNPLAVAPNSKGFSFEIAANMVAVCAPSFNNTPHKGILNKYYPDCPFPTNNDIGDMKFYDTRNELVNDGISTVLFDESFGYQIQDFVTFRRPDSQPVNGKDWRYPRTINIAWNVKFGYRLLEENAVENKTIVADNESVNSDISGDTIKTKDWKGVLYDYFDQLVKRALIVDAVFSASSLLVGISTTNPNRFETRFNYKTTGTVRIAATTAFAGFNYG